ncbi:unnamed protein product [Ceutorhynchus assimilis]|uniref:J domain-containing protein n=1 Tax=Ceutorhynchus assimilis TaxID=467358 RepID=A0A9N9MX31_9CUCU|nr:unnamed protein product [Ceutorhynchus assimilis]
MAAFQEKCQRYFRTSNFYEVLNVDKNASERDIKKSYHKLSLLIHPDKVEQNHKEEATEKFKILCKIHSILQDERKRRIYDKYGYFDEGTDIAFNWKDYWLSVFNKIELKDIQKYEEEYVGSETERRDIKWAYETSKGSMDFILDAVEFSNFESQPRIIEIVREMVDNGKVKEYERFFNECEAKRLKRKRKFEKERLEVETFDMQQLEKESQTKKVKHATCDASFKRSFSLKKAVEE